MAKDTYYFAVASSCQDFHEMTDEQVRSYLREALARERKKGQAKTS